MKKERSSNFEVLRIISMLLIISFHCVYKSGFIFETLTLNTFLVKSFYFFGELGVNLFVLITGYFTVNSKFKSDKLILLFFQLVFYVLLSYAGLFAVGETASQSIEKNIFYMLHDIAEPTYWFFTAYVLLYVFSPFINALLKNISKDKFKRLIALSVFIWSILPTVLGVVDGANSEIQYYYSRFIWLAVIYIIGAYIRLYGIQFFEKKRNRWLTAAVTFGLMLTSIAVFHYTLDYLAVFRFNEAAYFWQPNTIPMLVLSVSVFCIFAHWKLRPIGFVNLIASTTLGIYLLHDGVLQTVIWRVLRSKIYINSPYALIYVVIAAFAVFIAGAAVDLVRQLIEKYTIKAVMNQDWYKKAKSFARKKVCKVLEIL